MKLILPILLLLGLSANAQQKFTVYFNSDVTESDTQLGESLSKWITNNPNARVQKIYGYADKTGDVDYNQNLSERRIQYVTEKLKAGNIIMESAEQKGFGESQSTGPDNARDRKVVIEYSRPQIQPVPKEIKLDEEVAAAKKGDKIRLKNMNFYKNSDEMLPESKPVLEELLKILRDKPKLKIQIQGHVCCMPENEQKISQKRAVAVYKYLISKGINAKRLSYTSFGSTKPIYPLPEKTEAEMSANRRVEIEIVEN